MTRSIYIIGGAGTGKSTFTARLLDHLGLAIVPELVDLHSKANAKALVTLRGHWLKECVGRDRELLGETRGLYLGVMREEFPGSDGLDRATSPTGAEWLQRGGRDLPRLIISEGATLATRPFLTTLHDTTDLLVILLVASPGEVRRRFEQRGSNQDPKFVMNTVTRSENLAWYMSDLGTKVRWVWTEDPAAVDIALDVCRDWALQPAE